MTTIDSVYDPKTYEDKIWQFWMASDLFTAKVDPQKKPYSILMPPPNVTSQLHMGHGLGYSIQDFLIRWKRMSGYNAMWLPGTDHAGIATQMMVEKALGSKGLSRQELGRDAFVERCKDWKDKYGGIILSQFEKMGFSCDWSRVSYTMDPKLSHAVRAVFVKLYEEGLIYRGERLVNWDPVLNTAVSDDEVETKEVNGHLWYFRYPIEGSDEFIPIATTRPETMLGDMAVAVNPEDERFKHLIGKSVILPFTNRSIPIIGDDYVKAEFGTGAVKITPAHDPNDFEIGKRHNLPMMTILNDDATLAEHTPIEFRGLDRFVARKKILEGLKKLGLFDEEKPYKHAVPHSERSKTIIEPKLSMQWYVDMRAMAKEAADAARSGDLKFYPDTWSKTYLYWLDNIQDWCISRQLWWGHRIPIWYCQSCQHPNTGMEDPNQCHKCGAKELKQDEDVLDTWFSSWLWPLSPFGWPQGGEEELEYFYPTDTMVTAPEIIFLWVARMVMVGKKFLGKVPFKDVYFNATVCDKKGRKFSKTLGNGIDPLEVIDTHGADAVRYSAISLAPLGGRVRMAKEDFDTGSKFINKLWNASRMILNQNYAGSLPDLTSLKLDLSQKWLINELHETAKSINTLLNDYKINEAVEKLYHYIWGSLCDWGIEASKEQLSDEHGEDTRMQTLSCLCYCLEGALRLAHPVIPFVTEELWSKLPPHPNWDRPKALTIAAYPTSSNTLAFGEESKTWQTIQDIISLIRSTRTRAGIPHKERLAVLIKVNPELVELLHSNRHFIHRLAKLASFEAKPDCSNPGKSLTGVGAGFVIYIPVEGLLDINEERQRLSVELARLEKAAQGVAQKLKNPSFVDKAPEEVVSETRQKKVQFDQQIEEIKMNLDSLA